VSRFDDIEQFWDAILSEKRAEVLAAWRDLDAEERRDVEKHLSRMADPAEGFAEVQQRSATFALAAIRDQPA
jgi:hypothetical protein